MNFEMFRREILQVPTEFLLRTWLFERHPHAFDSENAHEGFKAAVRRAFPTAQDVCVAGTANWRFSLNPNKNFSEFSKVSDIDTVIVDPDSFHKCWDEIRKKDRATKDTRHSSAERNYKSAALSIYAGYVAPVWLLAQTEKMRFEFRAKLNSVSNSSAKGREVKALFFKSRDEVIDYYKRGVMAAKAKFR